MVNVPAEPVLEYDSVYPCGAAADPRTRAEKVTPVKPVDEKHHMMEAAFVSHPVEKKCKPVIGLYTVDVYVAPVSNPLDAPVVVMTGVTGDAPPESGVIS